jgi:hypothetical protein
MARWWDGDHEERYWLETTDRPDIGADLKAPETDDSGRVNWRHSLFKETHVGDVVLHYDKRAETNGIVGWSFVSGPWQSAPIVWAARGTYAREKGTQPHERPGFVVPLERFQRLSAPLTLNSIRSRAEELRAIVENHKREHGDALYFPFELSDKRPIRLLQGYAFKLPRAFLDVFPELLSATEVPGLAAIGPAPEVLEVESAACGHTLRRGSMQGFGLSPVERQAVEMHAMQLAERHLGNLGWRVRDVSATHSYDFECTRNGEKLIVEVKGTTSTGDQIVITRNEVAIQRAHHPNNALVVVHSINLEPAPAAQGPREANS